MGFFDRFKQQGWKNNPQPTQVVKTETTTQTIVSPAAVKAGAKASSIILAPLVTEKTAHLASQAQYVFRVEAHANKIQVRNAIREMYEVVPVSVNIVNQNGKKVRFGRTRGSRKDWKKAIVTLPKGKTIEVYEGV